jgi:hypothetical protein
MRKLIRLEVLREMAESFYIWIDKEDRAELLETADVLRRAERGQKAKSIYRVAQEMELRFQLVPRKRIEKARRVAEDEAERAEARRTRRTNRPAPAPVPFPAPVAAPQAEPEASAPAPRRARARRSSTRLATSAAERAPKETGGSLKGRGFSSPAACARRIGPGILDAA